MKTRNFRTENLKTTLKKDDMGGPYNTYGLNEVSLHN
jgi:hypothetical protein